MLVIDFTDIVNILVLFVVLRGPVTGVSESAKFFGLGTLFRCVGRTCKRKGSMSVIYVHCKDGRGSFFAHRVRGDVFCRIISFVGGLPSGCIFEDSTGRCLLIFRGASYTRGAVKVLRHEFSGP